MLFGFYPNLVHPLPLFVCTDEHEEPGYHDMVLWYIFPPTYLKTVDTHTTSIHINLPISPEIPSPLWLWCCTNCVTVSYHSQFHATGFPAEKVAWRNAPRFLFSDTQNCNIYTILHATSAINKKCGVLPSQDSCVLLEPKHLYTSKKWKCFSFSLIFPIKHDSSY